MSENNLQQVHRYETITFLFAKKGENPRPFSFKNTAEVVATNIVVTVDGDMLIAYTVKVA